jgi:hypothetical protein
MVPHAAELVHVDVRQEITVSLPGTSYIVIFPRPAHQCVLVNKPVWEQDSQTSITPLEFLNWAYEIAFLRARVARARLGVKYSMLLSSDRETITNRFG